VEIAIIVLEQIAEWFPSMEILSAAHVEVLVTAPTTEMTPRVEVAG